MGEKGSSLVAAVAVACVVTLLQIRPSVSVGFPSKGLPADVLWDDFQKFRESDQVKAKTCQEVCTGVKVDPSLGCRYSTNKVREEVSESKTLQFLFC